jgi:RimJ/RimL family protein N-acetyltransferase
MIEGKLINLRAMEMDDTERNHRWVNDREVTRHLAIRYPMSLPAEEAFMRARTAEMMGYTAPWFAIETKDGTHIGNINFHTVQPEDSKAHLGVMIGDKEYWSRGYGTDAMLTFLRFAFEQMNLHRVDLTVDAENERARACYRKCGFVEEALLRQEIYTRGTYRDQYYMGILRDEFYALHGGPTAVKEAAR